MANKGSAYDYSLLFNISNNKAIDIYNGLCRIASEKQLTVNNISNNYYIIKTPTNTKYSLYKRLITTFPYIKNKRTVLTLINTFIEVGILEFNSAIDCWTLPNLILAVKKRVLSIEDDLSKKQGFLKLKDFFFTEKFYNLKKNHKRILLFALLTKEVFTSRSKSKLFSNVYKADFFIDISKLIRKSKKGKLHWSTLIPSENIYYIRESYREFLSENKDLVAQVFDSATRKVKYTCKNLFQIKFNLNSMIYKNVSDSVDWDIELINLKNTYAYRGKISLLEQLLLVKDYELSSKEYVQAFSFLSKLKNNAEFEFVANRFINKLKFGTDKIINIKAYLEGAFTSMLENNEIH